MYPSGIDHFSDAVAEHVRNELECGRTVRIVRDDGEYVFRPRRRTQGNTDHKDR